MRDERVITRRSLSLYARTRETADLRGESARPWYLIISFVNGQRASFSRNLHDIKEIIDNAKRSFNASSP